MQIVVHEEKKIFHLWNQDISYIMMVLPNGQMGQLYYGKHIHDREDFSYLLELAPRAMGCYVFEGKRDFSLEHVKQEYGVYGTTDYRMPAVTVLQENGSRLSDFVYEAYELTDGKPKLEGLPATYVEKPEEAKTLTLILKDRVSGLTLKLLYTIFANEAAIARSACFVNEGRQNLHLLRAMSLCMDLPDRDYEWIQLSGAWSRERHVKVRPLAEGITAIDSLRGHSSHEHNPFVALKRPHADEVQGEVLGFSLVYSGNFLAQAEVDTHETTRFTMGIMPEHFDWKLAPGECFQTPEAVMVYSDAGLNGMSQTFHRLYGRRLARGIWRDRERPILINNWEATYFDFTEEKLMAIARKAKECGVELFVLDDGWFGARSSEHAGLGDWVVNRERLPEGIRGIAEKIEALGMKFGLWIEPEMVNKDSDLYRSHPEWVLHTPGRRMSHGRYQYVLDYARPEVVDYIYDMISAILDQADVSYIKWDMNRSLTEVYSAQWPAERQGEIFHRYILGVYNLYERLTSRFPHILFESCASGGARFDPGLLYYAPQAWTSDDTDAVERLKIQYGTSLVYPVSSMGAHVSMVPNHQLFRTTPLETRANVACFGTFGYELDLNLLSDEEQEAVKAQIRFMKQYRRLLQFGTFYRLSSPFEGNIIAWMCVSEDKREAIVGWYKLLNTVNGAYSRVRLQGLDPHLAYALTERSGAEEKVCAWQGGVCYGDELMHLGLITSDSSGGEAVGGIRPSCDFDSRLFILKAW